MLLILKAKKTLSNEDKLTSDKQGLSLYFKKEDKFLIVIEIIKHLCSKTFLKYVYIKQENLNHWRSLALNLFKIL